MYFPISLMIILFALLFSNVMVLQPLYNQEYISPTADASSLQITSSWDLVTLDGSNSGDPEGAELHYHWIQIAAKNVTFKYQWVKCNIYHTNITSVTNMKFTLTTIDGEFISSPSYVDVTVNPQPPPQLSTSKGTLQD